MSMSTNDSNVNVDILEYDTACQIKHYRSIDMSFGPTQKNGDKVWLPIARNYNVNS